MAQDGQEDEDDYLNMTFEEAPSSKKETSLQRTARIKKEAAERGRVPSKAELASKEKATRDEALATEVDAPKGAKIMAKMGFKVGDALGQSEDARKQPIELLMKDDRGGIGMDSEKKRKVREAAEALEAGEKRQKVSADEFRERNRVVREERRAEGLMWGAMKVLEGFEEDVGGDGKTSAASEEDGDATPSPKTTQSKKLSEINLLYRQLVKQRLEKDRERQMRIELNNSLSARNEDDSEEQDAEANTQYVDDEDEELQEFEAFPAAERLEKVVRYLREKYYYCLWCKYRYADAEMDGCPGLTEDEHG
jgi:hypothetical protein